MYFYKNEPNKKELDFIIQIDGAVVPIEVKSGNKRAKSLSATIKKEENISLAYKFADSNIGVSDDGIVTLPLYMVSFI